jgi:hypothetical protein
VNRSYAEMAAHYGTAIVPARHRTASTRRCVSTCRRATSATPIGRRCGSRGRPARSVPRPWRWSRSFCASARGFRACIGIMRLVKSYGAERLEAACDRALEIGARSYSSVNSILKTNRDRQRLAPPTDEPAIIHDNIRGPRYFH